MAKNNICSNSSRNHDVSEVVRILADGLLRWRPHVDSPGVELGQPKVAPAFQYPGLDIRFQNRAQCPAGLTAREARKETTHGH